MGALVKKDFVLNRSYLIMTAVMMPLVIFFDMSRAFMFVGLMIGLVFSTAHAESESKSEQFVVSLPVERSTMIWARFLFIMSASVLTLGYTLVVDKIAHRLFPNLLYGPMTFTHSFYYLCAVVILTSISLAFFSSLSFRMALGAQIVLGILSMGLFLIAINRIDETHWLVRVLRQIVPLWVRYPRAMTGICTLVIFGLAVSVSQFAFSRRDLVS